MTGSSRPPDRIPGVPRTRTAGLWLTSVLFAVVLLVLLIFILQNTQRASISFFGARADPPIGVALLLAAVFGVLLVALPGTARIIQLRVLARRRARAAARVGTLPTGEPAGVTGIEPGAAGDTGSTIEPASSAASGGAIGPAGAVEPGRPRTDEPVHSRPAGEPGPTDGSRPPV